MLRFMLICMLCVQVNEDQTAYQAQQDRQGQQVNPGRRGLLAHLVTTAHKDHVVVTVSLVSEAREDRRDRPDPPVHVDQRAIAVQPVRLELRVKEARQDNEDHRDRQDPKANKVRRAAEAQAANPVHLDL